MAYSRWSSSRWYTFWSVSGAEKAEDEVFDIDCLMAFTYRQLKDDIEWCLEKIKDYYSKLGNLPTDGEIDELRTYVGMFMRSIESDYEDELLTDLTKRHIETGDDRCLTQIKEILESNIVGEHP